MLKNKTILITGGSSGVGKMLVEHYSSNNKVIVLARRYDTLQTLYQNNNNVISYKADLAKLDELNSILNDIIEKYTIGYIINNAGIMHASSFDNLDENTLYNSINVNAIAPMKIVRKFLPQMKKNNFGRIVNLTSGAPLNCFPNYGAYSSSKAALNSLTVTLAKELKDYDIKINLMSPGPVKTEMAPDAPMDPSVSLPTMDFLLNLDQNGDSGKFYWLGHEIPLFPNLKGIDWLKGTAPSKIKKIL